MGRTGGQEWRGAGLHGKEVGGLEARLEFRWVACEIRWRGELGGGSHKEEVFSAFRLRQWMESDVLIMGIYTYNERTELTRWIGQCLRGCGEKKSG